MNFSPLSFETEDVTCPRCHSHVRFVVMPEWGSKVAMQSLHTQLSHLTQVSLDGLHQINDTLIRALYSQISPEEHTHCQKQLRDIIEVKHRLEQIARQIDISRFR